MSIGRQHLQTNTMHFVTSVSGHRIKAERLKENDSSTPKESGILLVDKGVNETVREKQAENTEQLSS